MKDFIIIAIILVVVGLAAWYIIRSKRRGKKCIGCPYADCPSKNGCCNKDK